MTRSGEKPSRSRLRRTLSVALPVLAVAALIVAWRLGVLSRFDSPERVAEELRSLQQNPLAIAYVLGAFALGTLLFMPITVLVAGTLISFGPVHGFVYALAGIQLAGASTYWFGRLIGAGAFDMFMGPRLARFRDQLNTHALRASIAARLLPLGNFTLLNWLIGGMRVPFWTFFLGNALGSIPGLVVFALFADRLVAAAGDPSPARIALLLGCAVIVVALGYFTHKAVRSSARRGG